MRPIFTLFILLSFAAIQLNAQIVKSITDADLTGNQIYQWSNDTIYVLDGLVFVEEGATLNIEAGTVVKFTTRADEGNPSALIISRGAKIFARGTKEAPIIFTSELDDVNNPNDLGPSDNALWGGIALLGKAVTQKRGSAEVSLEGIPSTETRAIYGGNDNNDSSGELTYVSIRHGGRVLTAGSELNGLSLGAVGSGTKLDYIEIYANSDDGIEFFGGAVNLKHAVVAFVEDDCYDWDEVYTGKGQFWFSIQRSDVADHGGELDGSTDDDLVPYSDPTIFNWTHIGGGSTAAAGGIGWLLRAGTAGTIGNSIVTELRGKTLEIQDKAGDVNDAYQKLKNGELNILNNLFWNNGTFTTLDASSTGIIRVTSGAQEATAATLVSHLTTNKNAIANPGLIAISRDKDAGLDPRPSSNVNTDLAAYPQGDSFFSNAGYKGAFDPVGDHWLRGWTALQHNGHLKEIEAKTIYISDNDLVAGQTYNWTKENTYILDGLVFVEDGATLNIEAGTVVKFTTRADEGNPSALVIARGAKIFAKGTQTAPIIFTSELDDVSDANDLGPSDNALWGGIALLGKAVTQKRGSSEVALEGIPSTETRALYGGSDNNDSSGEMTYVSIRHGGRVLTAGSELNGLSLGAVGSGTKLDYIEIYANSDDGIEFFGGAANLKHAVVAFVEDDCYDWDEVYTGKGQFWFSIQRSDVADHGGELDGSTDDDLVPYSDPTIFNWTHIGGGTTAAAGGIGWLLRAGTAGTIGNSIITELRGKTLEIQDKAGDVNDAYQKLKNGELNILNNLFWNNGTFTTLDASSTGIIRVTSGAQEATAATLVSHLTTNKNAIANPGLIAISRDKNEGLDPRPSTNVNTDLAAYPQDDSFFASVGYKGAFDPVGDHWLRGWTALQHNGHLKEFTTGVALKLDLLKDYKVFPNPSFNGFFTVQNQKHESFDIHIFDLTGRLIQQNKSISGQITVDSRGMQKGMYLIKIIDAKSQFATQKLILE